MHAPISTELRATVGFALLSGVTSLALLFAWIGTETLGLITAGGLGLMLITPVLSLINLAGLRLGGPEELSGFAGLSTPLDLVLQRRGPLVARDLLLIVEDGRRSGAAPTGHLAQLADQPLRVRCQPRFAERGRRPEVRVVVESSFPLGLFVARKTFSLPIDLLVLPRITRLGPLTRPLRRLAGRNEQAPRGKRGSGEFHALREWREGEPLRGIAWKPSARRGRLLARELVSEDHPAVRVVLVTRVEDAPPGRRHPLFERAVQLTASLLDDLLRRGQRVSLSIEGDQPCRFPTLRGRPDLRRALGLLAEVELSAGRPALPPPGPRGEVPIVVLVGSGETFPVLDHGLVIDVESPTGLAVHEASARRGVRGGQRQDEEATR